MMHSLPAPLPRFKRVAIPRIPLRIRSPRPRRPHQPSFHAIKLASCLCACRYGRRPASRRRMSRWVTNWRTTQARGLWQRRLLSLVGYCLELPAPCLLCACCPSRTRAPRALLVHPISRCIPLTSCASHARTGSAPGAPLIIFRNADALHLPWLTFGQALWGSVNGISSPRGFYVHRMYARAMQVRPSRAPCPAPCE